MFFSTVLDRVYSHPRHQVDKWELGSILTSEHYITLIAEQDLGCSKLPWILQNKSEERSTKIDQKVFLDQHWYQQSKDALTFGKYDNAGELFRMEKAFSNRSGKQPSQPITFN